MLRSRLVVIVGIAAAMAEAPLCRDSNEDCWARNRRAQFTVTGKSRGR
jgi:outer membrane protein OmpA-like peptidoglycan-associated protein